MSMFGESVPKEWGVFLLLVCATVSHSRVLLIGFVWRGWNSLWRLSQSTLRYSTWPWFVAGKTWEISRWLTHTLLTSAYWGKVFQIQLRVGSWWPTENAEMFLMTSYTAQEAMILTCLIHFWWVSSVLGVSDHHGLSKNTSLGSEPFQ